MGRSNLHSSVVLFEVENMINKDNNKDKNLHSSVVLFEVHNISIYFFFSAKFTF